MLLRTVSLNSTVSCVTIPTCERKEAMSYVTHIVAINQDTAVGNVEEAWE